MYRGNKFCFVPSLSTLSLSVKVLPCCSVWDFAQLEAAAPLGVEKLSRTQFHVICFSPFGLPHLNGSFHISHCAFSLLSFLRRTAPVDCLCLTDCQSDSTSLLIFFFPQTGGAKIRFQSCNNSGRESLHAMEYLSFSLWMVLFNLTSPAGTSWNFLFTSPTWKRKVWKRNLVACGHREASASVDCSGKNKLPL